MQTYLLLRDNKEKGPFSLQDLLAAGLKAYDLIWIPGKSAAWRYPSEIDELKPYAPVVEEQPYDRFFKKKESQPQVTEPAPVPLTAAGNDPELEKYQPVPADDLTTKAPILKKSVFVTLPAGRQAKAAAASQQARQPKVQEQSQAQTGEEAARPSQTITVVENPEALQVKYSQPLDEIKERYVQTLLDRKQRNTRRSFWLKQARIAGIVLALVGTGAILGYTVQSVTSKQSLAGILAVSQPNTVPPVMVTTTGDSLVQTGPETAATPPPEILTEPTVQPQSEASPATTPRKTPAARHEATPSFASQGAAVIQQLPPAGSRTEKALMPKGERGNLMSVTPELYQTYESNGNERNRRVRNSSQDNNNTTAADAKTEPRRKPANDAPAAHSKEITVSSNEYKRVPFGGIRNLQLTVYNRSTDPLEKVVVELQYLKPSEQPLKIQQLEFTDIAANSSRTIKLPDTNRGIDVVYKIRSVTVAR